MSETAVAADLGSALVAAHAAVDEVQAAPLELASDDELLEVWREVERLARRLPTIEHRLVAEATSRGLPGRFGCRSVAQFLRGLLRLDPREAHGRELAAAAAGERRAPTGEVLPAVYPVLAAAQAEGALSPRHSQVVVATIENLPDQVRADHGQRVEAELVGHARTFDPAQLGRLALRMSACLDPDGRLHDVAYREQHRQVSLHRRPDGSGTLSGECTALLAERLEVLFDALAAPKPETDGVKDPRTAGQRRHDALLDGLALLQRSNRLPATGGVAATIVLSMSAQSYATGTGLARTGHGALIPAAEAHRWAGADHRRLAVLLDSIKGVAGYSSLQRCFTEPQRLALHARDGGCTFPGCDAPPAWCEVHHLIEHAAGGPTSLDNAALVCRHDHARRIARGWTARLINGRVGWSPPHWIDPHQQPRFNTLHDTG